MQAMHFQLINIDCVLFVRRNMDYLYIFTKKKWKFNYVEVNFVKKFKISDRIFFVRKIPLKINIFLVAQESEEC